ncbi:carbamate kinase [Ilumatobacter nonamiensis]|uniref:carbamate kinase n=1 Tax=Ilumatobacter nonamiensis TaxID=467093 RepID=UPI00034A572E|nr:carbamate kinase [Ilumatobacter nonamiensis]
MRVVIALGGNALLRRGQLMSYENQLANIRTACDRLAPVAAEHELVIGHGNGPQVGLLALEGAAYTDVPAYPLDVLDAETQGMIGYLIELELGNRMPFDRPLATLLTMIEVDPRDPAFENPTKPIGPVYSQEDADQLAAEKNWVFKADGDQQRRVVPSPKPIQVFQLRQIRWLLEQGSIVICAGGGGIPTYYDEDHKLCGVEAVIDKDLASGLLAKEIGADLYVMATDADAAFVGWGTPEQKAIARAHPDTLMEQHRDEFAAGSMLPKVEAACQFARATGRRAGIGSLDGITDLVSGTGGTLISTEFDGVEYRD